MSLSRIINLPPRGIGGVTLGKWISFARKIIWTWSARRAERKKIPGLNAGKIDAILKFGALIERLTKKRGEWISLI